MAAGFGQRRSVLIIYGIVGIMGIVAVLISRGLYKDAFFLFTIALLYLGIIIVPRQPKKSLRKIITADPREVARQQERENLVWMLNTERERRRAEREAAGVDTDTEDDRVLAEMEEQAKASVRARRTIRISLKDIKDAEEKQAAEIEHGADDQAPDSGETE